MTLRIIQGPVRQGVVPVRVVLLADAGRVLGKAKAIAVSMPEDELMRQWYLEAYRHRPEEAESGPARLIRQRMAATGVALFESVFQASEEGLRIWRTVAGKMATTRVEIHGRGSALPWEQVRAEAGGTPLGLACRSFVYRLGGARVTVVRTEALRILFAICRPGVSADVDFRAVARLLIGNPAIAASRRIQFEVLRPPTLKRLGQVLRKAALQGQPYHVVHFDGHGIPGFLLFETAELGGAPECVSGRQLARILRRGGVAMLIMNACRSAYAPVERSESESVAYEIARSGAPVVVAMRYNVDVATAASFMAFLYEFLASSRDTGEAFTRALRGLEAMPAGLRIPDAWQLPVMVERASVRFVFTRRRGGMAMRNAIAEDGLPATPPAGVLGQDLALMLLDRFLSVSPAVAVLGVPGSGKTAVACEFARWFAASGGPAGGLLVYRDAAQFPSLAAMEIHTVSAALVILDNASEAYAAEGLHDWVRRIVSRRCKVLLVQRRAEGALLQFEGIRILDFAAFGSGAVHRVGAVTAGGRRKRLPAPSSEADSVLRAAARGAHDGVGRRANHGSRPGNAIVGRLA